MIQRADALTRARVDEGLDALEPLLNLGLAGLHGAQSLRPTSSVKLFAGFPLPLPLGFPLESPLAFLGCGQSRAKWPTLPPSALGLPTPGAAPERRNGLLQRARRGRNDLGGVLELLAALADRGYERRDVHGRPALLPDNFHLAGVPLVHAAPADLHRGLLVGLERHLRCHELRQGARHQLAQGKQANIVVNRAEKFPRASPKNLMSEHRAGLK